MSIRSLPSSFIYAGVASGASPRASGTESGSIQIGGFGATVSGNENGNQRMAKYLNKKLSYFL